jgi:two-component system sensor histidine kinase GlrK
MKLSIFSRLVIGYLAIFILAMAVSIYTIIQLYQLEGVTRSILAVDNRLIFSEQKLSDILLTSMRYEKKFIIIKDEGLYNQFLQTRDDFDKYLEGAASLSDDPEVREMIIDIKRLYNHYQALFQTEAQYLRSGEQYPFERYKKEKDKAINRITEILKKLRAHTQQLTYDKVQKLDEIVAAAGRVAIAIGIVALTIGSIISVFITVNITKPLSVIKKKTREIARGNFGNDLTLSSPPEIKELAQAFNTMCTKLKELDKMKSEFFSLMSHELRTPLTTIKEGINLLLESLKGKEVTDKQKRLITIINEECNRLINLVNSLLDLSKMEAGMMVYNFTHADIIILINKITREMEPLTETKNIFIETDISESLPFVRADIDKMLEVLRNLIGNAVKFTPNGGKVQISAQATENVVSVSVSDTGTGIPKERMEMIFDKFKRATLGDSGKIMGSGLGLYIVKQIINAHGGRIWVESMAGKGSTFTFVLPV